MRWSHYRSVWAYVEGHDVAGEALLGHFGDPRRGPAGVPCCDVCAPELRRRRAPEAGAPRGRDQVGARGAVRYGADRGRAAPTGRSKPTLDEAILDVVVSARPPVGRTRAVEILRGGRSKVVAQNAYDALAGYGAFAHLRSEEVLGPGGRAARRRALRSTGGRFPKLRRGMKVAVSWPPGPAPISRL